jgi:peptidoglycan hydrolase-like protein with peptidoglycan-binding domain
MRSTKLGIAVFLILIVAIPSFANSTKTGKKSTSHRGHVRTASWKRHGQQQIQGERAREIQEALIREHYLDGQPNGIWDARSSAAMRRYQAAQGWQSKVVPDSRALIKLGLGPSHENDLNPDLMGDKGFTPLQPAMNIPDQPQQ